MKKVIWILIDDRMGSVGQAKGIVQFLNRDNLEIIEKKIVYNKWARIPNFLKINKLWGVNKVVSDNLFAPYPDAVMSISRRTAPIARHIKKQTKGKCKIIQLMKLENWEAKAFDLLVVPKHDETKIDLPQVEYITGCTHRITQETLAEANEKWRKEFEKLPKPLTAVIVGGGIKGKPFSLENASLFGDAVKNIWKKNGGSLLITTSRRTGKEAENIIMKALENIPSYAFLWGDKRENPYMGFMACADRIIVTGDSVSMCSESCGTQKPVLIFRGRNWLKSKHLKFCQTFFDAGYACPIEDEKSNSFVPKTYVNPSEVVAEKIHQIIG